MERGKMYLLILVAIVLLIIVAVIIFMSLREKYGASEVPIGNKVWAPWRGKDIKVSGYITGSKAYKACTIDPSDGPADCSAPFECEEGSGQRCKGMVKCSPELGIQGYNIDFQTDPDRDAPCPGMPPGQPVLYNK